MVRVIEYYRELIDFEIFRWRTRVTQEDIEVPVVVIPQEVLNHLQDIGGKLIKSYNDQLEVIRENLESEIDETWMERGIHECVNRKFTELKVGAQGRMYSKGNKIILTAIPIPEFHISLRGQKGTYSVEDLLLVDSSTQYSFRGHICEHIDYDKGGPSPEIIYGHFHPPANLPEEFKHLLSKGDLKLKSDDPFKNFAIGDLQFLLSFHDTEVAHKVFMRINKEKIADVPYETTQGTDITRFEPTLTIEKSEENSGIAKPLVYYKTSVSFRKIT